MRCSFTRMSSIPSIVTPILMSSSTVFVDWFSKSCTVLSNGASLVGMSSQNLYSSTVHQESHISRPKLGLPFHHELPPGLEPFVHASSVTLLQRGSCSCHHQNAVHLYAECALFAPEICVESRCRRRFCLRQLFLIRLIRLNDQTNPRTSSDLRRTGLAFRSPVSTTPACTRCLGVLDMLCTCCASLSLSCASIVIVDSCCCGRAFSCWMAAATCSCSSGVDMVVYTRDSTRGACSFQVSAIDPSCDRGNRPATTFCLDALVTSVPWSSHRSTRFRETIRVTGPVFREATITAPLPCCECMQKDVPYTHLFCARREGLQDRMTHLHTARSDCVLNRGKKTDRLIYTSRFASVIHSSCIVLIKPGTVTKTVTPCINYGFSRFKYFEKQKGPVSNHVRLNGISSLLFESHTMSSDIDMKMILPVKFSGSHRSSPIIC